MAKNSTPQDDILSFLRKRDYVLVRELGEGATGKTVLLRDPQIDEHLVCKKYAPYTEDVRQELFAGFIREIKLLHRINHENIVRFFNYYIYPDQFTGYILMEYIDGFHVDEYVAKHPERADEVFQKAVAGFAYLERANILHRDIRPANIMVRDDGVVKIIDLGFGKQIQTSKDFEKSISLNWWCPPPNEFSQSRYDFCSEVYFVGKLFEGIIHDNGIDNFRYVETLGKMCHKDPSARVPTFTEVEKQIGNNQFLETDFTESKRDTYRKFADALCQCVSKIENGAKYITDVSFIYAELDDAFRGFMLEREVPDSVVVLRCFITGTYYYHKLGLFVDPVRNFLRLLKSSTDDENRIILANLHTRFDALPRYAKPELGADDVPF